VIEYYSQARRPARDLFFVIGTDLEGPMGRDLVPVAGREAADRLLREHHGERVLSFDEVTRSVAASLFRR
jgi:nitrous oxide reductase accessory protein NosL